jgi:hypothetical protein
MNNNVAYNYIKIQLTKLLSYRHVISRICDFRIFFYVLENVMTYQIFSLLLLKSSWSCDEPMLFWNDENFKFSEWCKIFLACVANFFQMCLTFDFLQWFFLYWCKLHWHWKSFCFHSSIVIHFLTVIFYLIGSIVIYFILFDNFLFNDHPQKKI